GKYLCYAALSDERHMLYLHEMAQYEAILLDGTERAQQPFFSPNSKQLGFYTGSEIKTLELPSGKPQTIHKLNENVGGLSWGDDNTIVYGGIKGLKQINAFGGVPRNITESDQAKGENAHRWPEMLPGSKAVLFTIARGPLDNADIAMFNFETEKTQILIKRGTFPRYSPTGHIYFYRNGRIMAMQFELEKLSIVGNEIQIIDGLIASSSGAVQYSFSNNGYLHYIDSRDLGSDERTVLWIDRNGNESQVLNEKRSFRYPRLSPDGRKIAANVINESNYEIWIYDIQRNTSIPFNTEGTLNQCPRWTPDGKWLTFSSNMEGIRNIYMKRTDGIGEAIRLFPRDYLQYGGSWSEDGNLFAFYELHPVTNRDIWVYDFHDSTISPLVNTHFEERAPAVSPRGDLIAYVSNSSGINAVYVMQYPGPGPEFPVSTQSGTEPVWAPNGEKLYYRNRNKMMQVSVIREPSLDFGIPEQLFEKQFIQSLASPEYEIYPDDNRFLMIKNREGLTLGKINIVVNWFEELKEKFKDENK
ncbi:TolB family protein, partial [candidate division KSB1 bacterium]